MQDRLLRSRTDRVIGGVCGGLAHYFDIDPVLVRLIFVLMMLGGGIGLLVYIVLWAVIPGETATRRAASRQQPGALPPEAPSAHWSNSIGSPSPFDPATFRYDPYTGQPINQSAYPRVGDPAQPERAAATGQTIDLRREGYSPQSARESPAAPPDQAPRITPVPPPYPPAAAPEPRRRAGERRSQFGVILLIFAALILASQFGIDQFFIPVLLIIGGFLLLTRR